MSMHPCIRSSVPHICLSAMLKGISCFRTHLLLLLFWLYLGLTISEASFRPQWFLSGSTSSGTSVFWWIKERRSELKRLTQGPAAGGQWVWCSPGLRAEPQTVTLLQLLHCSSPGNSSAISRGGLLRIESTLLRIRWRTGILCIKSLSLTCSLHSGLPGETGSSASSSPLYCDNTLWPKATWWGKGLFECCFQVTIHHWGKSG